MGRSQMDGGNCMSLFLFADNSTDEHIARMVDSELPVYSSPTYVIENTWIPFRSVKKPELTPIRDVMPVAMTLTPIRNVKPHPAMQRNIPENVFIPVMPRPEGTIVQVPAGDLMKPGRNFASFSGFGGVADAIWPQSSGSLWAQLFDFPVSIFNQVFNPMSPENIPTPYAQKRAQGRMKQTPGQQQAEQDWARSRAEQSPECGFMEKIDPSVGICKTDLIKIGLIGLIAFAVLMPSKKQSVIVAGK